MRESHNESPQNINGIIKSQIPVQERTCKNCFNAKWLKRGTIAIATALILLLLNSVEFRRDNCWVCTTCGARKHQTEYYFGYTTTIKYESGAIYKWMRKKGITHLHRWVQATGTGCNIYGRGISFCHEGTAHITYFTYKHIDEFVARATDKEILEFTKVMESGNAYQKQIILQKATKVILNSRKSEEK